jgi:hypothetical protein
MLSKLFKRLSSGFSAGNLAEQDKFVIRIELTLIRFVPEPIVENRTASSAAEALSWLDLATDTDCCVDASMWQGKFSVGDFLLWCSGDYACVRIGEHRSHQGTHLDSTFMAPVNIAFKDDDGSLFHPSRELIVPRQLAVDALRAWLSGQERPTMLHWD